MALGRDEAIPHGAAGRGEGNAQSTHPFHPFLRFPIQGFLLFLGPCRGFHLSTVFGTDLDGRWWCGRHTRWSDLPLCLLGPGQLLRSLWVLKGLPWFSCVPEAAAWGFLEYWLSLCFKAWAAGLWGLAGSLGKESGSRMPGVCCVVWNLPSPSSAPEQSELYFGVFGFTLWAVCVRPQEYSRMLVLAGHWNSMSSTHSFLNRENGPREGKVFLQGLRGSSAYMAHKLAHACGCFTHTSTHSSQMWSLWPWRLVGGIRLAVMREKTPGLTEPERQRLGHCLPGGAPHQPGVGLQAGEPWAGLSPWHQ